MIKKNAKVVRATDAELRGLFVRIRSLAKQPRKSTWSPCSNCDCSDCMRFRAIGKIATMAIDSNRLRDVKPKKAKRRRGLR